MHPVAAWWPRDVIEVTGPDAESFLQGQCSQDIAAVEAGGSALSFVLQPQGKVDALVRVTRLDDAFLLDVDGGFGAGLGERLRRFKLRVKAELTDRAWKCLAIRGSTDAAVPAGGLVVPALWPGVAGVDVLGESPVVPNGVELVEAAALEAIRVRAGFPAMGRELNERTIPAESGMVPAAVSFTKGCFTGQELVARIDSRGGHVPRMLRAVVLRDRAAPPAGAEVTVDGRVVGELTSVAAGPPPFDGADGGAWSTVALAYIRREVEPPAEVAVRWQEHRAAADVAVLPLTSLPLAG